jgi:hypothetical protein
MTNDDINAVLDQQRREAAELKDKLFVMLAEADVGPFVFTLIIAGLTEAVCDRFKLQGRARDRYAAELIRAVTVGSDPNAEKIS